MRRYIFSTDHKVIGKQYMTLSALMAIIGGFSAYIIRWQLAWPETSIPGWGPIGPDQYNATMTMHGTVMVFFVAMPFLLGGFGNYLIPIMVGADDMAFPRLNAMSFWTQFLASLVLIASMFAPEGPAASGWTAYTPLSDNPLYTGVYLGQDLWILATALEFASFLMGGVNFLTTVFNMRAPGMSLMRLPLFVWMEITAALVFLLSVGPLIAAAIMLLLDRRLGTGFFRPDKGGDPLMWEHLFWFFGHPEVYVVALPGFGIMLEVMPVFARKPIFGYKMMVYSTIAAGLLSFVVWAHHMFVSGMDPRLATPFSITTIMISVPFAIIVFAMIASLWRSSIRFTAAMLFALGGLADVHHRRGHRNLPRLLGFGHLHARHLFRGRAFPLHDVPGDLLRRHRGVVFLVPQDVRPHDERVLGQGSFLDFVLRVQWNLHSAVPGRIGRPSAAHL